MNLRFSKLIQRACIAQCTTPNFIITDQRKKKHDVCFIQNVLKYIQRRLRPDVTVCLRKKHEIYFSKF